MPSRLVDGQSGLRSTGLNGVRLAKPVDHEKCHLVTPRLLHRHDIEAHPHSPDRQTAATVRRKRLSVVGELRAACEKHLGQARRIALAPGRGAPVVQPVQNVQPARRVGRRRDGMRSGLRAEPRPRLTCRPASHHDLDHRPGGGGQAEDRRDSGNRRHRGRPTIVSAMRWVGHPASLVDPRHCPRKLSTGLTGNARLRWPRDGGSRRSTHPRPECSVGAALPQGGVRRLGR